MDTLRSKFINSNIPNGPSPNFVKVANVSPIADEKIVKDFFIFCGRIQQFELITDKTTLDQQKMALIEFESPSAAKTAILLSGAQIIDRHISVAPLSQGYDLGDVISGVPTGHELTQNIKEKQLIQENKSKSSIVAEILASGYILSSQIIETARKFDERMGISTTAKNVKDQIEQKVHECAEVYGMNQKVEHAKQSIERTGVPAKVQEQYQHACQTTSELGQKALQIEMGKKVEETYTAATQRGQEICEEALRIKEQKERKAAKAE